MIGELYRPRGAFQLSFKAIPQTYSLFAYQAEPSIESKQVKKEQLFGVFLICCQTYSRENAASTCSLSLKAHLILKQDPCKSSSFSSKYSCFFHYSTSCWIIKMQWSLFCVLHTRCCCWLFFFKVMFSIEKWNGIEMRREFDFVSWWINMFPASGQIIELM